MLENPERSGTERTEPQVIVVGLYKYAIFGSDMLRKIGVISMYGELISHPVPATKTGQAHSRQYRATPRI